MNVTVDFMHSKHLNFLPNFNTQQVVRAVKCTPMRTWTLRLNAVCFECYKNVDLFFFTDWFSEKFCIIILLFLRNNKLIYEDELPNTRASQIKTLNMFYLVIYWTQTVHNDFIFLRSIVLTPVGHSSNHEYHCWNLQDNRAVVRGFIALLRFSLVLDSCTPTQANTSDRDLHCLFHLCSHRLFAQSSRNKVNSGIILSP